MWDGVAKNKHIMLKSLRDQVNWSTLYSLVMYCIFRSIYPSAWRQHYLLHRMDMARYIDTQIVKDEFHLWTIFHFRHESQSLMAYLLCELIHRIDVLSFYWFFLLLFLGNVWDDGSYPIWVKWALMLNFFIDSHNLHDFKFDWIECKNNKMLGITSAWTELKLRKCYCFRCAVAR